MDKELENVRKISQHLLGTGTKLPDKVFGFVCLDINADGSALLTVIGNIPSAVEDLDLPRRVLLGGHLLADMFMGLVNREGFIDEIKGQRIIDSFEGRSFNQAPLCVDSRGVGGTPRGRSRVIGKGLC